MSEWDQFAPVDPAKAAKTSSLSKKNSEWDQFPLTSSIASAPTKRLGKTKSINWLGETNLPVVGSYTHPGGATTDVVQFPAPVQSNPANKILLAVPHPRKRLTKKDWAYQGESFEDAADGGKPTIVVPDKDGKFKSAGIFVPPSPKQQTADAGGAQPQAADPRPPVEQLMSRTETVELLKNLKPDEMRGVEKDYENYHKIKARSPRVASAIADGIIAKLAALEAKAGPNDRYLSQNKQVALGMLEPGMSIVDDQHGGYGGTQYSGGSETQGAMASQLQVDTEGLMKQEDMAARQAYAAGQVSGSAAGRVLQRGLQGVEDVAAGAARFIPGVSDETLNEVSRNSAAFSGAASQAATSGAERAIQGATHSAGVMAPAAIGAAVTGGASVPYTMAGAAALSQYGQAYQQATDAGLRGPARANFAAGQAAAEAVVSLVLTKGLKIPGIEGMFAKGGLKAATAKGVLLNAAKAAGRSGLEEIPDEIITALWQNVATKYSGVDPSKKILTGEELYDIAVQAFLMGAGGKSAGMTLSGELKKTLTPILDHNKTIKINTKQFVTPTDGAESYAKVNPAEAAEIAAAVKSGKEISRSMMEDLSLPKMDAKRRGEWAKKVADAVDKQVAAVQAELGDLKPETAEAGDETEQSAPVTEQAAQPITEQELSAARAEQAAEVRALGPDYQQRADAIEQGAEDDAIRQDVLRQREAEQATAPQVVSQSQVEPGQPKATVNPAREVTEATAAEHGAPQAGDAAVDTKYGRRGKVVSIEGDWVVFQPKFGKQYKVPVGRLEIQRRPGLPRAQTLAERPEGAEADLMREAGGSLGAPTVAAQPETAADAVDAAPLPTKPAAKTLRKKPASAQAEQPNETQAQQSPEMVPGENKGNLDLSTEAAARGYWTEESSSWLGGKKITFMDRDGEEHVFRNESDAWDFINKQPKEEQQQRAPTQPKAQPNETQTPLPQTEQAATPSTPEVGESPAAPTQQPQKPNRRPLTPEEHSARRAQVQQAFTGQQVRNHPIVPDAFEVRLANGKWLTVEYAQEIGPINRVAMLRSLQAEYPNGISDGKGGFRPITDADVDNAEVRGVWRLSTPDGFEMHGEGLVKLIAGKATDANARHEALHAARSLGLLTDAEWKALVDKYAPNAKTDGDAEESIAKGIEGWRGPTGLWNKIKLRLNRILSALKVAKPTADAAMSRITEGKVWGRKGKSETRESASVRLRGDVRYSAAWHGGPHDFETFSTDKIGTGEGAQAYGWGMYFTGSRKIAEWYRDKLKSGSGFSPVDTAARIYQSLPDAMSESERRSEVVRELERRKGDQYSQDTMMNSPSDYMAHHLVDGQEFSERMDEAIEAAKTKPLNGRLYEVDLKPSEDEYLLWDKPLSEQSEKVRKALRNIELDNEDGRIDHTSVGGDLYQEIAAQNADRGEESPSWTSFTNTINDRVQNQRAASEYLKSLGIRGIKYLDGSSRSQGDGSHNYVIFDDADVDITARYSANLNTPAPTQAQRERAAFLANPGISQPVRDSIDQQRLASLPPDVRPMAEVYDSAATIRKDRKRINDLFSSAPPESDAEMAAMAAEVDARRYEALIDASKMDGAMDALARYDSVGTEAARMLHARIDQIETPTQRNQRLLGDALVGAPKSMLDAIKQAEQSARAAEAAGDKTLAKEERERAADLSRKAKRQARANRAFLERIGMLPKDKAGWDALASDTVQTERVIRERLAMDQSAMSKIMEYWNSTLLSGPATQVRNLLGTPLNYVIMQAEKGLLMSAKTLVGKQSLRDTGKAFTAYWSGLAKSGAWGHAVRSYTQEIPTFDRLFNRDADYGLLEDMHGKYAIRGKFGRVVRGIGWGPLRAADQFWKALIGGAEVGRFAYRQAAKELGPGATSEAISSRMAELMNDHGSAAWQQALSVADKATFTEKGSAGRHAFKQRVKALRNAVPMSIGKFVVPFVDTPVNIAAQTVERAPILGIIRHLFKMRQNYYEGRSVFHGFGEAAVKQLVGFATFAALAGSFSDDDDRFAAITSGQHSDQQKRYSIKFGDKYLNYQGIEPIGSLLALMADWSSAVEGGTEANPGAVVLGSTIEQIANKPMLQGLGDILRIIQPSDMMKAKSKWKALEANSLNYAKNFGASWVPALYRQTVAALRPDAADTRIMPDDTENPNKLKMLGKRVVEQAQLGWMLEAIGAKDAPAGKYDVFGQKKSNVIIDSSPATDFLYRLFSPLRTIESEAHPGNELLAAWNRSHSADEKDYSLPTVSPYYTDDDGAKKMFTEKQFERLQVVAGDLASKLYAKGNFDPKNPTKEQVEFLTEKLLPKAKDAARKLVQQEAHDGKQGDVDTAALADKLSRELKISAVAAAKEKLSLKKRKGEADFQKERRIAGEKERRDLARETLKRLKKNGD